MMFELKYAKHGKKFTNDPSVAEASKDEIHVLKENEIVLDMGNAEFGGGPKDALIFDTVSFDRFSQSLSKPSLTSVSFAVLFYCREIIARLKADQGKIVIYTHESPDYDALCASYLLRCLYDCEKRSEERLVTPEQLDKHIGVTRLTYDKHPQEEYINHYDPQIEPDEEGAWPILLASVAACLTGEAAMHVPREQSLYAVLEAARKRKRNLSTDGFHLLFDSARKKMKENRVNPLYDAIFTLDDPNFGNEMRLLSREREYYEEDVRRARKALVMVPISLWSNGWYRNCTSKPLPSEHPDDKQDGTKWKLTDGIFIRNPKSILFKSFAREDVKNSSLRQGFRFTAITESDRVQNPISRSSYSFALDPKFQDGAHLYPVWEDLQRLELNKLKELATKDDSGIKSYFIHPNKLTEEEAKEWLAQKPAREGYAQRAEKGCRHYYSDPWYDGASRRCTIVRSPTKGTAIDEKTVEDRVKHILESKLFKGDAKVYNYPLKGFTEGSEASPADANIFGDQPQLIEGTFRLVEAFLHEEVKLSNSMVIGQIGHYLWKILEGSEVAELDEGYIIRMADAVAVWSRRGVAIARVHGKEQKATAGDSFTFPIAFQTLALIASEMDKLHDGQVDAANLSRQEPPKSRAFIRERVLKGRELQSKLFKLKLNAASPEGTAFQNFLQESKLEALLDNLDTLNHRLHDEEQEEQGEAKERRDNNLQWILGIVSLFGVLLAMYQVEGLKFNDGFGWFDEKEWGRLRYWTFTVLILMAYIVLFAYLRLVPRRWAIGFVGAVMLLAIVVDHNLNRDKGTQYVQKWVQVELLAPPSTNHPAQSPSMSPPTTNPIGKNP
ncbi:MAG: hypothetical protein ACAI35_06515 [Candidatus Methylacidiphilales bacterium]